jgi:hypothetical protein
MSIELFSGVPPNTFLDFPPNLEFIAKKMALYAKSGEIGPLP